MDLQDFLNNDPLVIEQNAVFAAAHDFIIGQNGPTLGSLVDTFRRSAVKNAPQLGPDLFHIEAYGQALTNHVVALADVHEALARKIAFLSGDMPPELVAEPLALTSLNHEMTRVYELTHAIGQGVMQNLRDTADIADNADQIAAETGQVLDQLEIHGQDVGPPPQNAAACQRALREFSKAVAGAYSTLVKTELDEMKLELGYYAGVYGTGTKATRPLHDIVRIFERAEYAGIVEVQAQLVKVHQNTRYVFLKKSGAGAPGLGIVN